MATYKHNTFHFDDLVCLGPFNIYATYELGSFVVRRGQQRGCDLWRQRVDAQT